MIVVTYEGLEWFAVQATQPGVCFCSGKKKHFSVGDWVLFHQGAGFEYKTVLSTTEFNEHAKVIS